MINLSIIIVNYNVKEFLHNSLESILKASSHFKCEIIVVDNNSDDGSVELVREKFKDVKLIANTSNVGFGCANNQALEISTGKFILLINPDTIVKEDTFIKMIDFFNTNPKCGLAGCKVLNPDGSLQLACRRGFPGPWTSFTKTVGLSSLFPHSKLFARYNLTYLNENETYEVDAVSGAFMMFRRDVYNSIGGFDPQFFMYGEDLDLCYRAQKAGYKVYYVHNTEIIHYKGESTKRSRIDETKIFYDAMHLFVQKHFSSSFVLVSLLQAAIVFRKIIAFANVYKIVILSALLDFVIFSFSIYASKELYLKSRIKDFPEYALPWVYILTPLMQVFISAISGAYKKKSISVARSSLSLVYGMLFISSLTFFFKHYAFSRAAVLITYLISFIIFILWRVFLKAFFKIGLESGTKKTRTLIVGEEKRAEEIASKLKSNLTKLYKIVGFISLSRKNVGNEISSYKVIGSIENINKIIVEEQIDKVIFSSEDLPFNQMFRVVADCQGLNAEFLVAGKERDYLVGKSSVTMLDDIPLLKVQYNISILGNKISKRVFDLILSILFLFLVYPFIYLASKFTSSRNLFSNFILEIPGVFTGKKSFVGPKNSSYSNLLYIGKPGVTGLWFIENLLDNEEDEMKKLDLFYAKNQSSWLDIEILGKTFSKMFF